MDFDATTFPDDGYALVERILGDEEVDDLRTLLRERLAVDDLLVRRRRSIYGVRGLLRIVPELRALGTHRVMRSVVDAVRPGARLVRGILFDKSRTTNWAVPWHQDLTIPVSRRCDVAGFDRWSTKLGNPHVQPPVTFLESMLTVRLHLDESDESAGPLRVIPGSHRNGRLSPAAQRQWIAEGSAVTCETPSGGAVLMSPLILHSSRRSTAATNRRVLHLEFAADPLPSPLAWYEDERPAT